MVEAAGHHVTALAAGDFRDVVSNAIEPAFPDDGEQGAAAGGEPHLLLTIWTGSHEATVIITLDSCLSYLKAHGRGDKSRSGHFFA